jgi:hypothetical protein
MKKIIICIMFIALSGCAACVKYPDRPYNEKTGVWYSPPECYDWAICEYNRTQIKNNAGDCKAEFMACSRARAFLRCADAEVRQKISDNQVPKAFGDCMNALR